MPDATDLSQTEYLRSSLPAVDLPGFFQVVQEGFNLYLDSLKVTENDRPILAEDFPKERLSKFDNEKEWCVILYRVQHSEIAGTAPDGVSRKPKGMLLVERRPHPKKTGYLLVTSRWQEMSVVEFTILAKSNKTANIWCNRFHRFMMLFGHREQFFRSRGVEYFTFKERLEDLRIATFGQELESRRLRYQIRVEYLDVSEIKTLDHVVVNFGGDSRTFDGN